jgi:hypothetical protein
MHSSSSSTNTVSSTSSFITSALTLISTVAVMITPASSAFAGSQRAALVDLLASQEFQINSEETHPIMESQPYETTCYRDVSHLERVCHSVPVGGGSHRVCEDRPERTCVTPPGGRPQCRTVIAHRCHTESRPVHYERRCGFERVTREEAYGCVKERLVQVGTALDYRVRANILVSAEKLGDFDFGSELNNQLEVSLDGQNISSRLVDLSNQNNLLVLSRSDTSTQITGEKQKLVSGQIQLKLTQASVLQSLAQRGISRIHYENDHILFTTASGLDAEFALVRIMIKRDRLVGGDTVLFDAEVPATALQLTNVGGETQGRIDLRALVSGGLNSGRHRIELIIEPAGNLSKAGFSLIQGNSIGALPRLSTALKLKL